MSFSPFLIVEQACGSAQQWANYQLLQAGLRTVQTFDLKAARSGAHDFVCFRHGTDPCDCQMVILLVYGSDNGPETLILTGSDGRTCFSFADTIGPVSRLALQILEILEPDETES